MAKIKVELNETRIAILKRLLPYFRTATIESDKTPWGIYNMSFNNVQLEVLTSVIEELVK